MKKLFTALLLLVSVVAFSQKDTVMMNDRFENDPGMQKYQLSALMDYTAACNTSFFSGIAGALCFTAAALIPDIEPQSKLLFMMCGAVGISISIGYHVASFNIIDNPTNIVPVNK